MRGDFPLASVRVRFLTNPRSFPTPSLSRATQLHPEPRKLDDFPALNDAFLSGAHPRLSDDELGRGAFIMDDWRRAWFTYGRCDLTMPKCEGSDGYVVDPTTGEAEYEIVDVDGVIPDDLVGVLYRIGELEFCRLSRS